MSDPRILALADRLEGEYRTIVAELRAIAAGAAPSAAAAAMPKRPITTSEARKLTGRSYTWLRGLPERFPEVAWRTRTGSISYDAAKLAALIDGFDPRAKSEFGEFGEKSEFSEKSEFRASDAPSKGAHDSGSKSRKSR